MDGHDKLMGLHKHEFPIAIHGCIDSFSRKIIWLRAWPSNSSPELPARLYYKAIQTHQVVPNFIRTDRGNENTIVSKMHNFFRESEDGLAHIYGSSVTNQVIERWWREFRERNGNFFRDYIQELVETGLYSDKDETSRTLLAILLIPLLQSELDQFQEDWNTHRIRKQKINRPCAIPNFMFEHAEEFGSVSQGIPINENRLQFIEKEMNYLKPMRFVDSETFCSILSILSKRDLSPVTTENMIVAYSLLRQGCKKNGIILTLSD